MNTSITEVIDNAIPGIMLRNGPGSLQGSAEGPSS
jgi:hypothetical protein